MCWLQERIGICYTFFFNVSGFREFGVCMQWLDITTAWQNNLKDHMHQFQGLSGVVSEIKKGGMQFGVQGSGRFGWEEIKWCFSKRRYRFMRFRRLLSVW